MSVLAISASGIAKQYRLGKTEQYRTLRESIVQAVGGLRSRFRRRASANAGDDQFWALQDVSFDVKQGDVLGVIGRNGAGKSTLLKILSRITDPTKGYVDIRGRVGSLLEVGTGFHPELTGRENIYLSGAILGMPRADIIRKFDEMVAFADVERFVDTPVKHYSSGMYLRLAFAVAAHLEPEILLVDEVLAVGDARFQRKCMDKMQAVGQRGCTVLFVSHNMPAITRLCERAILLEDGKLVRSGPAHEVVSEYMMPGVSQSAAREWPDIASAPGTDALRLRAIRIVTEDGLPTNSIDIRHPVGVEIEFDVLRPEHIVLPYFVMHNTHGVIVFCGFEQEKVWRGQYRPLGRYRAVGWIPGNLLSEGIMLVGPGLRSIEPSAVHCYERDAVAFQVIDAAGADTARGDFPDAIPGAVRPLLKWTCTSVAT